MARTKELRRLVTEDERFTVSYIVRGKPASASLEFNHGNGAFYVPLSPADIGSLALLIETMRNDAMRAALEAEREELREMLTKEIQNQ